MKLQHIELSHFRNISHKEFDFDSPTTFILGENAHGKTNILEAIYFITMGQGFRDSKEEELLEFGQSETIVRGEFENGNKMQFQIFLKKDLESMTKTYTVNKAKKKPSLYLKLSTRSV